ncbi:interleukin-13 receptor subunit alpha-2-like isoform X2 [Pithys albifrons albifrons]|uniref:interleukin-13 receptor subunit alpha-2-like isoform X2 n=1 Tax=Pithys albifrons albifrons TaxID=3385563 RepID=UPI003A5CCF74
MSKKALVSAQPAEGIPGLHGCTEAFEERFDLSSPLAEELQDQPLTPQPARQDPELPPPMALRGLCTLSVVLLWGCVVVSSSSHTTVAPPRDLQITDPGLLGALDVEWKPPPNVQTSSECTVKYKFEYHNTGDTDWKVPLQGKLESQVQNFHCIYHDWEYLKCTWQPGLPAPPDVHYGLYYWYEGLAQAAQCEDYTEDHGMNVGCTLRNLSQAEYRDLNICVNGSAAATLLRPLYTTLRLQNLAKPSPPRQLVVSMSAAEELHVMWSPPRGQTPPQCLEYEVEMAEDLGEAKPAWQPVSTQMETAATIPRANQSHISCVRVRGRTNFFCADQGFWSEWAQECFSVSRKEDKQLFILIPVILSLSSSLIIFMLIVQCKKRSPAGKPFHASVGC